MVKTVTWRHVAHGCLFMLAYALAIGICFRYQLLNHFAFLTGDNLDGQIEIALLEHWANVLRGISPWSETLYFYPAPATLGYNDGYFLFGLIYSPFRFAGVDPLLANELTGMTVRAIGFPAFYWAARRITKFSPPFALLGAFIFTINNGLFLHALHAQLLCVAFAPLLALLAYEAFQALLAGARMRLLLWGAAFLALFAAVMMTGFYVAWFFVYFCFWFALALALLATREQLKMFAQALWRAKVTLLALMIIGIAVNLPFVWLYVPKAHETGMHHFWEIRQYSSRAWDMVDVGPGNLLYGGLRDALYRHFFHNKPHWTEPYLGLPLGLLGLGGAALACLAWTGRRKAIGAAPHPHQLMAALAMAVLFSWLMTLQLWDTALYFPVWCFFPGARAIRAVGRFQLFLVMPMVALALFMLTRLRRRLWPVTMALMALLVAEELNGNPPLMIERAYTLAWLNAVPAPPAACREFYVAVDRTERWPRSAFKDIDNRLDHSVDAMLVAEVKGLPTLNGHATFAPAGWTMTDITRPAYGEWVQGMAARDHLTGLCALDLKAMRWTVVADRALASQPP